MIAATLVFLWTMMIAAPRTPIGRTLHRALVIGPAVWLARITRGHMLLAGCVVAITGCAFLIFDGEAVRLLAMAAPDALAWATMIDLAAVLDGVVVALTVASAVRWRGVRLIVARRLHRPTRSRRRRTKPQRPRTGANDDEPGPAALAA